ncbi:hypothetical protein A8F94_00840 [Bacillus sp. FJAT-27225]|uniref:MFS transporter n=1 Tax=Bacillus sp. FJAT-27225 TaxID=1743144 RepID=UPI00080C2500|nr:MFS transporter [Bacillus sp. FJAT-27225]OCA90469.1 hypothetical protein A8F94_00840 [Bacillus sp. FJAT-27225]
MKLLFTFNRTIRTRMLLNFVSNTGSAMVMPYTVVYFSNKIGTAMTTATILLVGIFSLLGYLIGGRVTDSVGRKSVILFSEIVAGLGFLFISYFNSLNHFSAVPIIVLFCIIYFCESAANPAYSALIIDASEEHDRRAVYTYFMWISTVAFAMGSVLGGFFFENYSVLLFFIVGALSLTSAFCTHFFIEETNVLRPKIHGQINKRQVGWIGIGASQILILLCTGKLLLTILTEQFPNYLTIRIVSNYPIGIITGYNMVGYLNLEDTLITAFVAGIIIKATSKFSEKAALLTGLILFVAGYVSLSYFIQPVFLFLGMMFISIGSLIYVPTLQSIIAKTIPEESRGSHLSILGFMGALGGMLASLFIWGMEHIPEFGITCIYIFIGICIIYNYSFAYRLVSMKDKKQTASIHHQNEQLFDI